MQHIQTLETELLSKCSTVSYFVSILHSERNAANTEHTASNARMKKMWVMMACLMPLSSTTISSSTLSPVSSPLPPAPLSVQPPVTYPVILIILQPIWALLVLPESGVDWQALIEGLTGVLWEECDLRGGSKHQIRFSENMASIPWNFLLRVIAVTMDITVSECVHSGVTLRFIPPEDYRSR